MKANEKIEISKQIIEEKFAKFIEQLKFDFLDPRLKITLSDGTIIFIQYNNHDQYSYTLVFSNTELDRCRFDNYDDRWQVPTKPHHFHPRKSTHAIKSPMRGDPSVDITILFDLFISGKIFQDFIEK